MVCSNYHRGGGVFTIWGLSHDVVSKGTFWSEVYGLIERSGLIVILISHLTPEGMRIKT